MPDLSITKNWFSFVVSPDEDQSIPGPGLRFGSTDLAPPVLVVDLVAVVHSGDSLQL